MTRAYVVRTEQQTALCSPQLVHRDHRFRSSLTSPGQPQGCGLIALCHSRAGAERAGHLLPPPCLTLGRGALRAGPHQGLVAFFLTLKRSAIICHCGPRFPLSPPHNEVEDSWPKVRVGGGPGNIACGGCSLLYVFIKSDRGKHSGCVCTCVNGRSGYKACQPVCKQDGWSRCPQDRCF